MTISPQRIIDIANAYFESCVLFSACDSGIFSTIARHGPCSAQILAEKLSLDRAAVEKLADACTAMCILEKTDGHYHLTDESRTFLVPGMPADLSGAIRYNRDVFHAWGRLTEFMQSGRPVERPEIHLGEDERRTRDFVMSMHYRALGIGRIVIPLLKLDGVKKVVDIGGGPGTFSVLIAKAFPSLTCTVVDLPPIAKIASELISEQGMESRVTVTGHDYHKYDFQEKFDAALFFGVLHQESPESIVELFKKAHAALNPGAVLYVMDVMTDATHTAPKFSTFFSLNMALTTQNGWVFSDSELRKWLELTGYTNFSVQQVGGAMPHWLARASVKETGK